MLDQNLGLKKNPFSKYSAEEELEFHNEIFYAPNYYSSLLQDLTDGVSRIIVGQRGHGKSTIIHKLKNDLEAKNVFTILIDRFDGVPITKNERHLLNLLLEKSITRIAIFLMKNKHVLNKLDRGDKEKLSLFIRLFFKPMSSKEYNEIFEKVKKVRIKNFLIRVYNKFVTPLNHAANIAVNVSSSWVNKSLGMENVENQMTFHNYFSEVSGEENITDSKEELLKQNKASLKQIIDELTTIIKKIGFETTVILFDKIDEFQELEQDLTKIAEFSEEILTDTELLLSNKFSIAFSIWSEVKNKLDSKVRFDKFKEIDIRWQGQNLEPLINKRLKHFSLSHPVELASLVRNENDKKELISICDKSPRDLISVLYHIHQEQFKENPGVNYFDSTSISRGMNSFATKYDYPSIHPSRKGKNMDVKSSINKLLRIRKTNFTLNDVNQTFNQKTRASEKMIQSFLGYKLIEADDVLMDGNITNYIIKDPKIKFLIRRNVPSIE